MHFLTSSLYHINFGFSLLSFVFRKAKLFVDKSSALESIIQEKNLTIILQFVLRGTLKGLCKKKVVKIALFRCLAKDKLIPLGGEFGFHPATASVA